MSVQVQTIFENDKVKGEMKRVIFEDNGFKQTAKAIGIKVFSGKQMKWTMIWVAKSVCKVFKSVCETNGEIFELVVIVPQWVKTSV